MKARKFLLVALLLSLAGAGSALAHGHRGHVGVYIGPYWDPWMLPPYYYPPPVVVVRPEPPPVYIEQNPPPAVEAAPSATQYWYYCASSKAYYPYVKECPGGWQKVLPQPER